MYIELQRHSPEAACAVLYIVQYNGYKKIKNKKRIILVPSQARLGPKTKILAPKQTKVGVKLK